MISHTKMVRVLIFIDHVVPALKTPKRGTRNEIYQAIGTHPDI